MKDPRAGKRRRISDTPPVDEDGDIAMHDDAQETLSDAPGSPTPSTAKSRRSSRGAQKTGPEQTPERDSEDLNAEDIQTPSRTGTRSSGRTRRAPQRFEDEVRHTRSTRKSTATSTLGTNEATPKSTRRPRHVSETGNDRESPDSPAEKLTRTRSKRATVRFDGLDNTPKGDSGAARNGLQQPQSPDDYQDGLDDLVSMQLQQDIVHEGLSGKEEVMSANETVPIYAEQFQAIASSGVENEVRLLTKIVIEKLNGKRLVPLKGLEYEYHKVYQVIEQTVTVGEGNSMLLLGSRGSGKSAIVETTVSSLKKAHKNDFHVVRLNGFLHTDDRLALREIWRQLGRETDTEEEAGKVTSYADTMATLLALLSHPEELGGSSDNPEGATAKSIVIVLDEFDLFVTHPRQTLLYNLFDIAQARKAPLAVLGLTTKVDVTDMLEKRVKSRFSHRSVYVPLPRTLEVFSEICLAGLSLEDDEVSELLEELSADERSLVQSSGWGKASEGWRMYLQGLWADAAFQTHLRRIYHQTKSVKEFFTSALMGLTELHHSTHNTSSSLRVPIPTSFTTQLLSCPDPAPLPFSTSTTAASPSSLPLSLLLAATRLTALYDPGLEAAQTQDLAPLALSFPATYAEYVRLLTSAKTSASVSGASVTPGRVWGRDVAREAWEKLVSWGLISPVGGGSGTADGRMFRVEVSFEEVVAMAGSGGSLGRWWRDG
ncbi:hypothetical protein P175DRAFT_0502918 [Aspergillus ochraceoroseus IBT 24754]|uniref:Origin recognition complex subunit 4 n=2 Tax=Aspergillus ochraceoroseus TaxID=138278 RepID=A0A2T5LSW8_9EURO|nr:uncharacterized protein P175DRAFT_0502918 [Aspergillus ochraceoroseus IBT 24754]KKK17988.1 hypothetical protein AOCH_001716 [Aspergillus ochraceoroseus]PTU19378.1 hypothetical protein P175DRAFT_0502918 [Aspergillus ochraceoroseus IBT 24754]